MTRRRKKQTKNGRGAARSVPPFPYEFRLKVARLYLEDGYPAKLIASQFGISDYSVYTWAKRYREQGEQGLVDKSKAATGSKLPEAVSQSIVDLKKANPDYGARRISDILKRFFWLRTSASTVQRTLRDQDAGRPENREDPARAVLEKQMADLQKENRLLEQKMILKDLAAEFDARSKDRTKKK
jgi:transposase-like protein